MDQDSGLIAFGLCRDSITPRRAVSNMYKQHFPQYRVPSFLILNPGTRCLLGKHPSNTSRFLRMKQGLFGLRANAPRITRAFRLPTLPRSRAGIRGDGQGRGGEISTNGLSTMVISNNPEVVISADDLRHVESRNQAGARFLESFIREFLP
jgi:hypothetical protein